MEKIVVTDASDFEDGEDEFAASELQLFLIGRPRDGVGYWLDAECLQSQDGLLVCSTCSDGHQNAALLKPLPIHEMLQAFGFREAHELVKAPNKHLSGDLRHGPEQRFVPPALPRQILGAPPPKMKYQTGLRRYFGKNSPT